MDNLQSFLKYYEVRQIWFQLDIKMDETSNICSLFLVLIT